MVGAFASIWSALVVVWDFVPPLRWVHHQLSERNLQVEYSKPASVFWLSISPVGRKLIVFAFVKITNHGQFDVSRVTAASVLVRRRVFRWWWRTRAEFPLDMRLKSGDSVGPVTGDIRLTPITAVEIELNGSSDLAFPVTFKGALFYRLTLVGSPRSLERKMEDFAQDPVT
ncbi:MAG: hypothetical protein C0506_02030 [Anaerolinea sp.]|nr:hypothetical protein [Anaerolinea sp.]